MPPSKQKILSSEETGLFQDAVSGVKPLQQDKIPPFRQKPLARLLNPQQATLQSRDDLFSDRAGLGQIDGMSEPHDPHERLLFYRSGLQRTTLKKLRRGQIRREAELDLHGYTVAEARVELTEFIHFAMDNGLRCLRIIHGKGKSRQPILKQRVDYWLRQREEVLAFCSAIGRDGGTGAIYLLLRRIDRIDRD